MCPHGAAEGMKPPRTARQVVEHKVRHRGVCNLNWGAREALMKRVPFETRPNSGGGQRCRYVRKSIRGRGDS